MQNNLNIRGEPVQTLYSRFRQSTLIVNRRYQRKLVWTLKEKQKFIDSLVNQFPVPLFLGVNFQHKTKGNCFEIIDGMQRLEAINSFIECRFSVNGHYFDLSTVAETNKLLQEGSLIQRHPVLSFEDCKNFLNYPLPFSTSNYSSSEHVDETFRRINTGGVRLSRHEVRQAGAVTQFSDLVRKCAIYVRGDASHSDIVDLSAMRAISVTKEPDSEGINIYNTFWHSFGILSEENILASRDEEIIAHIISFITNKGESLTYSNYLDKIYTEESKESKETEECINKISPEIIYNQFCHTFNELKSTLEKGNNKFTFIYKDGPKKTNHAFQVIFLAFHNLIIKEKMKIKYHSNLAKKLEGIAETCLGQLNSDKQWHNDDRKKMIAAVCGVIRDSFIQRGPEDPTLDSWADNLEHLLNQSRTENVCYDFKVGFHRLEDNGKFDKYAFSHAIKTLTAMSNSWNGNSYVIVGIADKKSTSDRHEHFYGSHSLEHNGFYITGINNEAEKYHKSIDEYQQKIYNYTNNEPLEKDTIRNILSNARIVKYHDKEVIVFKISRKEKPIKYNNEYYTRSIANTDPIPVSRDEEFNFISNFIEQNKQYPYDQ